MQQDSSAKNGPNTTASPAAPATTASKVMVVKFRGARGAAEFEVDYERGTSLSETIRQLITANIIPPPGSGSYVASFHGATLQEHRSLDEQGVQEGDTVDLTLLSIAAGGVACTR